ncbi:MAG: anion permease, partial [Candidatus Cloacimonadaceae bacterium]|nr:anion permease [Candidatus Cloacimonadaceae bacterium]
MDAYLDKIQLIHFFLISYLISRVFVRFKLPQRFVYWLCEEKHVSISRLTWLLISGTALLSIVIANVITLMTLVPVLILIQAEYEGKPSEKRKFSTLVMLAAVWGANIGGMGMLTGTTTNGILVGMFEAYKFPISHSFTFLSWATWALPLAAILCVAGWLVLMLVFRPNQKLSGMNIRNGLSTVEIPLRAQKLAIALAVGFMLSSGILSFTMTFFRNHRPEIYMVTSLWTLLFLYVFFQHRFRIYKGKDKIALLTAKDILHDVPKKGLLWIMGGVL